MKHFSLTIFLLLCCFSAAGRAADRVLLIGIENYQNTPLCQEKPRRAECVTPTLGGEEDAVSLAEFAVRRFGFARSSIKLLLGKEATAANIEKQVQEWLINGTQPGDRVFFLYSGHGSQIADDNGDENDGLDEVLAPFDVIPSLPPKNVIRDDRINQWLRQLTGRRVVWLVDSCYSGTIWRGGNDENKDTNARFLQLPLPPDNNPKVRPSNEIQDYSPLPRDGNSRDIVMADDNKPNENQRDEIVVITSSMPYQQAFSVLIEGKRRGALSYLFEKVQSEGELPSVEELEKRLQTGMAKLGTQGVLPQQKDLVRRRGLYQIPTIEIISDCSRGDLPLFAINKSATCSLNNKKAGFFVKLEMFKRKPVYFFNDEFHFSVQLSSESYLYILVFSAENVVTRIFPNEIDRENRLKAGTYFLPRIVKDKPLYDLIAQKPAGRDVWVALATKKPLNLDKDEYTWTEIFEILGLNQTKQEKTSNNPASRLLLDEWQVATLVIETRAEP